VKILRAAAGGVLGILCFSLLQSCGGYGSSVEAMLPSSVKLSISPTSVAVGQSATITWSSTVGTTCTASGAWSGAKSDTGSESVTPTAAGSQMYTLVCVGSIYASSSASQMLSVAAASTFSLTDLVANAAGGTAMTIDPNLIDPWGLSIAAGSAPAWVSNNGTQTSTLYDGNGVAQPPGAPLIVTFAAGASGAFKPTGVVANASTTDFLVSAAGTTAAAAAFLFDGEGGMLAGWSPSVDATHAVTTYADTAGAVYKGLAIATNAGGLFLYATDFHNNKIDVFNTSFVKQPPSSSSFTFVDPHMPPGYAPFGIQAFSNGAGGATQIYVTYAQQLAPANQTIVSGAGLGFVDIFDTNGQLLISQFVAVGELNAPWGLALAPADFGTFSNALLVGNVGDGKINAYDPASGAWLGALSDASNAPLVSAGLLGIAFGNDANAQPHNTLFFTAGPNAGADGIYGRIDLRQP
jgi:uncharacterized protein (TIGR03118 family)